MKSESLKKRVGFVCAFWWSADRFYTLVVEMSEKGGKGFSLPTKTIPKSSLKSTPATHGLIPSLSLSSFSLIHDALLLMRFSICSSFVIVFFFLSLIVVNCSHLMELLFIAKISTFKYSLLPNTRQNCKQKPLTSSLVAVIYLSHHSPFI